eukprot:g4517.t1
MVVQPNSLLPLSSKSPARRLKHLVVDSGAIIKGIPLANLAENLWTVDEVLLEIKDKRARQALDNLPTELQCREPSPDALKFIATFARKTGDLRGLSNADMKVLALTYMLEKENNGTSHLRSEPPNNNRIGTVKNSSVGGSARALKLQSKAVKEKKSVTSSEMTFTYGLNLIVRNLDANIDEKLLQNTFMPHGKVISVCVMRSKNGKSRRFGFVAYEESGSASNALRALDGFELNGKPLKIALWKPREALVGKSEEDLSASTNGGEEKTIEVSALTKSENDVEKETFTMPKTCTWGKAMTDAKKENSSLKVEEPEKNEERKMTALERRVQRRKKKLEEMKQLQEKADQEEEEEEEERKKEESEKMSRAEDEKNGSEYRSRIVGKIDISMNKTILIDKEEDENDTVGWITPGDGAVAASTGQGWGRSSSQFDCEATARASVGCITTDFAMQNMMLQIGLHLLSANGMVIRRLKQWVVRCDGCFTIHKDTSKLFCGKCGGDSLRKLAVTVNKDGTSRYHYNRSHLMQPVRGCRYSIPKAKGGRAGQGSRDLLLRADQLHRGDWRLKAGKKTELRSMFGADVVDKMGLVGRLGVGASVIIGMGRKNPNQRRGRERRGAKKANEKSKQRRSRRTK